MKKKVDLLDQRSCGVLMHPTGLVSSYGCGDIGKPARDFLDWLKTAGFSWWQMLPITPMGEGWCPYSSSSAFAGESLLISMDDLKDEGLLSAKDFLDIGSLITKAKSSKSSSKINFNLAKKIKYPLLVKAYKNFSILKNKNIKLNLEFKSFVSTNKFWLEDFSLFSCISEKYKTSSWNRWPEELKNRDQKTLCLFLKDNKENIEFECFKQFIFFRQWKNLKEYARCSGVYLMGDIPIFVAWASSDVWANQKYFHLDKNTRLPKLLSGAPPDNFCKDGQLWGSPIYNWKRMSQDDFSWWTNRFKHNKSLFDSTRIDHFIGFYHLWATESKYDTAKHGKYLPSLGRKLFTKLYKSGSYSLVAEDLGQVSAGVEKLRDDFNLSGMRIVEFGFGMKDSSHFHHPDFYPSRSVSYIGTHDMSTATGWIKLALKDKSIDKKRLLGYLGLSSIKELDIKKVHLKLIEKLLNCRSNLVIFQLQDLLGLDDRAKTNTPGTTSGNWIWKLSQKNTKELSRMKDYLSSIIYGACRNS